MARLEDLPETLRHHIATLDCATPDSDPWVAGPPLSKRRVALISTAGLQVRGDRPFEAGADDYRIIPGDVDPADLIISHISTNFDRTGFQQDYNVMFPLARLHELAAEGAIGSVARHHYSFMGATSPEAMAPMAEHLAGLLKQDRVDAALLVPV